VGATESQPRPGFLLLLTDDQRFDSLGCTGNPYAATPHLDRLAREGATFSQALVTTSLCCPSRASLWFGAYPHAVGVLSNETGPLSLDWDRALPARLQQAGYRTAFVGKWHLDNPGAEPVPGFDHWVSFEGRGSYYKGDLNVNGVAKPFEGRFGRGTHFLDDVLTDHALEWLAQESDQPFFLALALKSCHRPFQPPRSQRSSLADRQVRLPGEATFDEPALPRLWKRLRAENRAQTPQGPAELRERYQAYLELVQAVDANLGRLLADLEERDLLKETCVLFTSDNGFLWGEHGFVNKIRTFEPSLRVPLLIRYPAEIPAGLRVERPVLLMDLAPTVLDLAGEARPGAMDGESLRGHWKPGEKPPDRESTLHYEPLAGVAAPREFVARSSEWKYTLLLGSDGPEEVLYHLEEDPDEVRNLGGDPAHGQARDRGRRALRRLLGEAGAPEAWLRQVEEALR